MPPVGPAEPIIASFRPAPTIPTISTPAPAPAPAPAAATEPTEPFLKPVSRPRPGSNPWSYRAPLLLWTLLLQLILYRNSGYSWHFFSDGGTLILGGHPPGLSQAGGLHLYANYPQLQFGPLTLLTVVVLLPFTAAGGWMIASWFMTLSGLVAAYLVEQLVWTCRPIDADTSRATMATMLIGGVSFLLSWELLAVHFGHLDDVLALVLLAAAALATAQRRPVFVGVLLGLATDAKPWALACAALLLALPRRTWWRACASAALVIGVAWLPFVLADPGTLHAAASFTIPNVPASALRALGVNSAATPSWDRLAQLGSGCLLGVLAVLRGRWQAVIALGIGARIALDPSVYSYYTAGLALGLLCWDLIGSRRPLPVTSLVCFVGLTLAPVVVHNAQVLGELRLWSILLVIAIILVAPSDGVPVLFRWSRRTTNPSVSATGRYR
ncbi:MAG TPA: hypothetical protein VHZ97_02370 [Pseudonocardiaceae bacterium]|jgi:hypothetical protein|nr:hypothetical protein [Pseudonocardiaceae bacterium]